MTGQEVLSDLGEGLPLGEAVYRALREALRSGVYRPGDRLREEEVANRLNVSRTPVREAFGRLVSKGLVVPGQGRGLTQSHLPREHFCSLPQSLSRQRPAGIAGRHCFAGQHNIYSGCQALIRRRRTLRADRSHGGARWRQSGRIGTRPYPRSLARAAETDAAGVMGHRVSAPS